MKYVVHWKRRACLSGLAKGDYIKYAGFVAALDAAIVEWSRFVDVAPVRESNAHGDAIWRAAAVTVHIEPFNGIVAAVAHTGETLGVFDLEASQIESAALCVWNFLDAARLSATPPVESPVLHLQRESNVVDFTTLLAMRERLRKRSARMEILEEADSGA
jgi:hypothetical protein